MWFRGLRIEQHVRQLDSADADVCARAADWLGEHGDQRAVDPLIESALYEEDETVRGVSIAALSKLGTRGAVVAPALIALLKNSGAEVANAALTVITGLGGESYFVPLFTTATAALKPIVLTCPACSAQEKTNNTRALPARACPGCKAPQPAVEPSGPQPISFFRALMKIDPVRTVSFFVTHGGAPNCDGDLRDAMRRTVAETRDPALVTALGQLSYSSDFLKDELFGALVAIGEPAVGPLIELVKDRRAPGRRAAAELLGRLKEPRAIDPLASWLGDEYDAEDAATVLCSIGGPRILDLLLAAFAAMTNPFSREKLAFVISTLSDPRAAEPLIAVFRKSSFRREPVGAALINNGHVAVLPLDVLVGICDFKDETVYRTVVDYPGSDEKDGWSAVTHEEYSHTVSWSHLGEIAAEEIARRRDSAPPT